MAARVTVTIFHLYLLRFFSRQFYDSCRFHENFFSHLFGFCFSHRMILNGVQEINKILHKPKQLSNDSQNKNITIDVINIFLRKNIYFGLLFKMCRFILNSKIVLGSCSFESRLSERFFAFNKQKNENN